MGKTIAESTDLKPETVDDLLKSGWLYLDQWDGGLAFCNRQFHSKFKEAAEK